MGANGELASVLSGGDNDVGMRSSRRRLQGKRGKEKEEQVK